MLFASLASFSLLRLAINDLQQYYQELPDSPSTQSARYFPDITEHGAGTKVVQPLKIDDAYVTFLAKLDEAHGEELLASEGKAPALTYCGPISSNGKYWYGSLQMVVMEFPRSQMVAQEYGGSVAEEVRTAVRGAVQILHDQLLVHRDIRIPNIVIVDGAGDEGGG
ncbi:uncharacterized protein ARMOST_11810 [Armillaria ostoyae]|uniref:Protein kinase domain-containing protein n=1 Tax=Armillaria ostoyae TaxID=47428 RepID=A0A284RI59_ARMOS|nr:uncharacterized protein ARMOST_11810 [Armillaria ostoyae]